MHASNEKLNVLLQTLICISVTTLYSVAPISAHAASLVSPYILQSYVSLFNASVIVHFICLFMLAFSPQPLRQPLDGGQGWWCHFSYFIPLLRTWLAAISMTLMMKAIAKAHIRLFRTHVCLTCCVGLEPGEWSVGRWGGGNKKMNVKLMNYLLRDV